MNVPLRKGLKKETFAGKSLFVDIDDDARDAADILIMLMVLVVMKMMMV